MQEYEPDTGGESRGDAALRLEERAYAVEALQQAEREWIAASTGDWQAAVEADAHQDEAADVQRGAEPTEGGESDEPTEDPTPSVDGVAESEPEQPPQLGAIPELSAAHVRVLSRAGIESVPDLVEADVAVLSDLTGYDRPLLRHWQAIARLRL